MTNSTSFRAALCAAAFLCIINAAKAQYPSSCASLASRANSNGQATSCPNNGGAMATNFLLTSYANVPGTAKTGNLTLTYSGSNLLLTPYAITRVWLTSSGTSLASIQFGPASPPSLSGGNTQVSYCFYGTNMATVGTLSFELTNPQTGVVATICSYDASCASNCTVVATPTAVLLPVSFTWFKVLKTTATSVRLGWATGQEENNKGFEIQRSSQDSNFTTMGFVPSSHPRGNSSNSTEYSFTDNYPPAGRTQYRLRQIDLDNKYVYSSVVTTDQGRPTQQPEMYGAHDRIVISLSAAASYDALVYDTQGRVIQQRHFITAGTYTIANLSTQHVYYVTLQAPDGSRQTKTIYLY